MEMASKQLNVKAKKLVKGAKQLINESEHLTEFYSEMCPWMVL